MSVFIDTSVLVRYLTGDPPRMLEAARRIVDASESLAITDVVLVESAFVLLSFYQVPREAIVDTLVDLLRKENVHVHALDKDLAIHALLLCRPSGRVSFADAMLWAVARSTGDVEGSPAVIYSFDERFPTEGIEVRRD